MSQHHFSDIDDEPSHDDVSVMRSLLETVKGLSFVSASPELELVEADDEFTSDVSFS